MALPRISLCMIVRDEGKMIDACLASVKGLVSEMVVVDTGSQDDTVARAKRAGAKVWSAPWRDDFAWARNESLGHATGDWVLILDADERIAPCDFDAIRRALARGSFDCAMLRLHDASTLTASREDILSGKDRQGDPQRVPRLVRRKPDLAYVGVIHEDLGPWIHKHGRKVVALDMDIVHYGAASEIYNERGKFERNVKLLTRLAADMPEDPTALGYLAHQYLGNDELALARQAVDEGWRRVRYVEEKPGPSVLRLAEARVQIQLKDGDARGALETAVRTRRIEGGHYDLDYISGFALELLGAEERDPEVRGRMLHAAKACFETCLASAGVVFLQAFVDGATSWAASTRLGVLALLLGDPASAAAAFRSALQRRPNAPEARLGLLEASIRLGPSDAALLMVGDLLEDAELRRNPDVWVLGARACEAAGAIDDMATFLAQARTASAGYITTHRRLLHGELVAGLSLYRGSPIAASGLVGCIAGLIARAPIAPSDVGAWPSELGVVRMVLRNLGRTGQLGVVEPLFEPRAEVVVPGLTAHVRQVADELGVGLRYEAPPSAIGVRGDDAPFVAGMLSTHPRLRGRVHVLDAPPAGWTGRLVEAGNAPRSSAASPQYLLCVSRRALEDDPVKECDRLLSSLGEGSPTPLLCYLAEAYAQRRTSPSSMSP